MTELIIYTLIGLFFSIVIGIFMIFQVKTDSPIGKLITFYKTDNFLTELITFSIFNILVWPILTPLIFLSVLFYYFYKSAINLIKK